MGPSAKSELLSQSAQPKRNMIRAAALPARGLRVRPSPPALAVVASRRRLATGTPPSKESDVRSVSAGLPDWIEHWDRDAFRKVGYGLALGSVASLPAGYPVLSAALTTTTAAYWAIGLNDIRQTNQTIRRNFPVLGNMRYCWSRSGRKYGNTLWRAIPRRCPLIDHRER